MSKNRIVPIWLMVLFGLLTTLPAWNQILDTTQYQLDEILVTGRRGAGSDKSSVQIIRLVTREEIEQSPANDLNELLDQFIELDIRQRGPVGIQADPSMRGGSFDQVAILLNGVNITDAQTGHFSLDIPVPLSMISCIEILSGPGAKSLGVNSLSGAINIITLPPDQTGMDLNLSGGQHGLIDLSGSLRMRQKSFYQQVSANWQKSSGYIGNTDFKRKTLYYQAGIVSSSSILRIEGGWMNKAFGANSFYTPLYPNQFEEISSRFTSLTAQIKGRVPIINKIYYRGHTDRFELFREDPPSWYKQHNYHLNQTLGVISSLSFKSDLGLSLMNMEVKYDWIWSTVLGDTRDIGLPVSEASGLEYNHFASRWFGGIAIEQVVSFNRLTLDGGLSFNYFQAGAQSFQILPTVNTTFEIGHGLVWFSGINRSFRLPTYTELFYKSPTNEGNPDLLPETAWQFETGLKRMGQVIQGSITGFYRYGMQTIDWVRESEETVWKSKNHTDISTYGAETSLKWFNDQTITWIDPKASLEAGFRYTFQSSDPGDLISKYILDYLRWKWTIKTYLPFLNEYSITMTMGGQLRNGTYTAFDPDGHAGQEKYPYYWLLDARIARKGSWADLFIEGTNILNTKYFDLGQLFQPGRWIHAGILIRINTNH